MTEEKELEVFLTEIFRDLWLEYGIILKESSIPASTERMINTYKSCIVSAMPVFMRCIALDVEKNLEGYISRLLSSSATFHECATVFLTEKKEENIFKKALYTFAFACELAALCHREGHEEYLQIIISICAKHFACKGKNDLYTNGGWEGLKIYLSDSPYSIEPSKKSVANKTKKDLRRAQLNKETVFKPIRSSDKIQLEKYENDKHFACKKSVSHSISSSSDENDLSDLSDYEIIGKEVFPIRKISEHRSHGKQVSKILNESFSQQNKECRIYSEIIQSDIKKNPKCSTHETSLSNTNANIRTPSTGSESTRYDRQSEDHENPQIQEGSESTNCLNVSQIAHDMNVKKDILRCSEIMHESRKSRKKILSLQNERKLADTKNVAEASVDKLLNMKESESKSEVIVHEFQSISAICEEVAEIYKNTDVSQDYISLLNSFGNSNKTISKIEPKEKAGKLASKSDNAEGKYLHHGLLQSKDVKLLKNNSNNSSKNEMQSSAPSGNHQVKRINVEHKEESKERFDLAKEKDLEKEFKLSKSGKRNKKKKKKN